MAADTTPLSQCFAQVCICSHSLLCFCGCSFHFWLKQY